MRYTSLVGQQYTVKDSIWAIYKVTDFDVFIIVCWNDGCYDYVRRSLFEFANLCKRRDELLALRGVSNEFLAC